MYVVGFVRIPIYMYMRFWMGIEVVTILLLLDREGLVINTAKLYFRYFFYLIQLL